jgi:hypothetical protein
MTFKSLSIALCTTALVGLALPAIAQDKTGTNVNPAATASPAGGAATMGLAQELYALGVAQGDALTVVTAAKLAASVSAEPGTPAALVLTGEELASLAAPTRSPRAPVARALSSDATVSLATAGAPPAEDAEGDADAPPTADAMFAKAKELAADDEALLGLIADAEAEGSRGRIGGSVQWISRLPSGRTDVWEIPFYGNSYAEIAVVGDGDANLDVVVTDENGNVFCYDVSWSDTLYCDFTPAWDGYFYVTVENLGGVRNSYHLLTN